MKTFLRRLFSRPARPAAPRFARPRLEALEKREVLNVAWHGGPVIAHAQVQALYLGNDWANNPQCSRQVGQLDDLLSKVVQGSYMDMLAEYSTPGATIGRGNFNGHDVYNSPLFGGMIDDSQVLTLLKDEITAQRLAAPTGDQLYAVFTPPNVIVTKTNAKGVPESSAGNFNGYHGQFIDSDGRAVTYLVIPYAGGANTTGPGLDAFQTMTLATSHELAEAVTDPDVKGGWYTDNLNPNGVSDEIGDLAAWQTCTYQGYTVQQEWSNNQGAAVAPADSLPSYRVLGTDGASDGALASPTPPSAPQAPADAPQAYSPSAPPAQTADDPTDDLWTDHTPDYPAGYWGPSGSDPYGYPQ